MRSVLRAAVAALLALSGLLWLAAVVQRWWPDCTRGQFDTPACLWAQSNHYERFEGAEAWAPIAHTAHLEGASMLCLAFAATLLPRLWGPGRTSTSLAVLVPAACVSLLGVGTWVVGPSGSAQAAAVAGGAPLTALVWVFGLPAVLLVAALPRRDEVPIATIRCRLLVACLVGLSNPLAAYFIGPMFTGYMSHDDPPWSGAASAVFLVVAAAFVWPSSRAQPVPDRRRTELETVRG